MTDHWSSLEDGGVELKIQASNRGLVFPVTGTHPGAIQEPSQSHLIRAKDTISPRKLQGFHGAVPGTGGRGQICIYMCIFYYYLTGELMIQ